MDNILSHGADILGSLKDQRFTLKVPSRHAHTYYTIPSAYLLMGFEFVYPVAHCSLAPPHPSLLRFSLFISEVLPKRSIAGGGWGGEGFGGDSRHIYSFGHHAKEELMWKALWGNGWSCAEGPRRGRTLSVTPPPPPCCSISIIRD